MDTHPSPAVSILWKISILAVAGLIAATAYVDGILIQINEQFTTLSEFRERLAFSIGPQGLAEDETLKDMTEKVYEQVFTEMLVLERGFEKDYTVEESMIKNALNSIMERNGLESEEQLAEAVKASGMTMEELRDKLKRDILIDQVLYSEVYTQRDITDWELETFYDGHSEDFMVPEMYRISTIILLNENHSKAEMDEMSGGITRQLAEGIPFSDVARSMTEGPAKESGGDLGTMNPADLSPELHDALKNLKPGEVSDPVEQPFGRQWLYLEKVIPEHKPPLAEVRAKVQDLYLREKYKDKYDTFIRDLKNRYHISEHKNLLENLLD